MPQKYFIKCYGCQMNVADSERLAGVLESAGYQATLDIGQSDIVLVNTCVVRKHAEDRASGYISSLKGLKRKNPQLKIGVCGCLVTEPERDVKKLFPHVDVFIGPNQPEKLAEFIRAPSPFGRGGGDFCVSGGEGIIKYITIMHGCDNFCSYCIVPYVRGREYSRPIEEILSEIKQIDADQYKEIFLLGQNVNSYKYGLDNLLRQIESQFPVPSSQFPRIRFMTSHPRDMSDEIISAVEELPHVCEYFHLPIQHGDDDILKSMNRGYTADYYRKLVDRIRSKIPGAAITSDVIAGFPGETDEQFRRTLYIIEQIGFDACNTAAYSVRPGTAASKLPDDVPGKVKQERLQEAMKAVEYVARKQNEKLIDSVQEVLVDKYLPYSPSPSGRGGRDLCASGGEGYSGRTRTNKIVKFTSNKNNLLGKLVDVRITSVKSWVLEGEIINAKF